MSKRHLFKYFACVSILLLLVACGEQQSEPNPTAGAQATAVTAISTLEATPTDLPPATATAMPPTVTVAPTQAPPPTSTPLPPPQVAPAVAEWLQTNAIPFDTAVPRDDYQDLMPLKEMIGDARIVSLGEQTHGTREFFQMKHRLIAFLVEEMGFNVVAFEASWPGSQPVNTFIQTGEGNATTVVRGMGFRTWNTEEVVDLVTWLRQHNSDLDPAQQVQFAGFDMQIYDTAVEQVEAYLGQVDPDARPDVLPAFQCIRRLNLYLARTPEEQVACQERLADVAAFLAARESEYVAQSSSTDFATAVNAASIVRQAAALYAASELDAVALRDRFMAENVARLLEQAGPEGKVVLWAHNAHIDETESNGAMGSHLQAQFGEDVVSLGFAMNRGVLNALHYDPWPPTLNRLTAVSALPQSLGDGLRSTGLPRAMLDLRTAEENEPVYEWLNSPLLERSIGAVYYDACPRSSFFEVVPAQKYDIIIYLEEPTPARPLDGPAPAVSLPAAIETDLNPVDLDFEGRNLCWDVSPAFAHRLSFPAGEGQAGSTAASIEAIGNNRDDREAAIIQLLPVGPYRGQQVRLTGFLRTSGVTGGAGLFFDTVFGVWIVRSQTADDALIVGDTGWTPVELVVDVPAEAEAIAFGAVLKGDGTLWVDNLTLTPVE